jgi:hypothetical protein
VLDQRPVEVQGVLEIRDSQVVGACVVRQCDRDRVSAMEADRAPGCVDDVVGAMSGSQTAPTEQALAGW